MFGIRDNAYAKLNLTLNIVGAEGGYHMLDSLVTTIDIFDKIVVRKRKDKLVNIKMMGLGTEYMPPEKNNAYIAAEKFIQAFGTNGVDISIYKNIPIGAGLGGSSTDASAVIRSMAKLFSVKDMEKCKALCDECGSDTGYLLNGGFARMTGRGEKVEKLTFPHTLWFFMIMAEGGVNTGKCYHTYDEDPDGERDDTQQAVEALGAGNLEKLGQSFYNALQKPAIKLNANVKKAIEEAESFSPLGVAMTGSGSMVFAMFETRELCEWAKSRYRGKFKTYVARSIEPNVIGKKLSIKNPFVLSEEEIDEVKE